MAGSGAGNGPKRSRVGRITAQLPPPSPRNDAPPALDRAQDSSSAPTAPLVVDEAMPYPDVSPFEELDATDPEFGSSGPLDTNVMLAAFDDATDVKGS